MWGHGSPCKLTLCRLLTLGHWHKPTCSSLSLSVKWAWKYPPHSFGGRIKWIIRYKMLRAVPGKEKVLNSWYCCSVTQSCPTLCNPMDCSTPGLRPSPLPEFTQTPVHWVGDAIQPSHPLWSPSPPAFNFFQHQGLFQRVSSSNQVAKVLEFQLQHQSFHWIFRTDFL